MTQCWLDFGILETITCRWRDLLLGQRYTTWNGFLWYVGLLANAIQLGLQQTTKAIPKTFSVSILEADQERMWVYLGAAKAFGIFFWSLVSERRKITKQIRKLLYNNDFPNISQPEKIGFHQFGKTQNQNILLLVSLGLRRAIDDTTMTSDLKKVFDRKY